MEEVFKKADISQGINVDGEKLTNLKFADNVALFNEKKKTQKNKKQTNKQTKTKTTKKQKTNGKHLNSLNSESLIAGVKYAKERQNT